MWGEAVAAVSVVSVVAVVVGQIPLQSLLLML
jgi:hypothetical protein